MPLESPKMILVLEQTLLSGSVFVLFCSFDCALLKFSLLSLLTSKGKKIKVSAAKVPFNIIRSLMIAVCGRKTFCLQTFRVIINEGFRTLCSCWYFSFWTLCSLLNDLCSSCSFQTSFTEIWIKWQEMFVSFKHVWSLQRSSFKAKVLVNVLLVHQLRAESDHIFNNV